MMTHRKLSFYPSSASIGSEHSSSKLFLFFLISIFYFPSAEPWRGWRPAVLDVFARGEVKDPSRASSNSIRISSTEVTVSAFFPILRFYELLACYTRNAACLLKRHVTSANFIDLATDGNALDVIDWLGLDVFLKSV